jgi:pimeloyl-ACP methyl ester carboxylesterase
MKRYGWILIIMLIVAFASTQCSFQLSKGKEAKLFKNSLFAPVHHYLNQGENTIHYVSTGDTSLTPLLFVHGSPGGWADYASYLKDTLLLKHFHIAAVDRPGFGESDYGYPMPSLGAQSQMVGKVIAQFAKGKPLVLVGHSYGGPLVCRINMDYPASVSHLLLLAASIDPNQEVKEWYRPVLFKVSFFLPGALVSSNAELFHLQADLVSMDSLWPRITSKVTVIHGTSDMLVPYANTVFAAQKLRNTKSYKLISLPKVNHFIPWTHFDTVKKELLLGASN